MIVKDSTYHAVIYYDGTFSCDVKATSENEAKLKAENIFKSKLPENQSGNMVWKIYNIQETNQED